MAATKTLLTSMEWIKRFIYNRSLNIGDFKEPIITSANNVMQTMLGRPFRWPENRVVTGFLATAGQQDYLLLYSWPASQALTSGTFVIDAAGNVQKVTTPGTTGATIPSFNSTLNGTTTDNTVTWTNVGAIPNAAASYLFGWLENASVQDPTTSKWIQIQNKVDLALDAAQSRPQNISAELIGTLGVTFRLMPVPDKAYLVAITMQQGAPLFTSLNQTWAPLPDYLGYIYNLGLLSYAYEFSDDARWTGARQRFIASLLGAAQGLSQTEVNIFLMSQWQTVTGQPMSNALTLQQGIQHRAI